MKKLQRNRIIIALLLLSLIFAGCGKPEADPDTPAPFLTIRTGKDSIVPYSAVVSSVFKSDGGQVLHGTGWTAEMRLPVIASELPTVTANRKLSFQYGDDCSFKAVAVFNQAFQRVYPEYNSPEKLQELPSGSYYIAITVYHQGEYYEAEKKQGFTLMNYYFKLDIP